jgi:2-polyprenyl-3-methyl-5-hydroxy-6-metoxy-1,4-benzoquinol methylase
MSVGSHLQIRLDEYDSRIRTFIPAYEQLLAAAARALCGLDTRTPHITDLGTGTGALAAACLRVFPGARITGIDEDDGILEMARERMAAQGALASFVQHSFLDVALPACDAIVASLALHHVRTPDRKRQLYRDCRAALGARGLLVSADCYPPADASLAAIGHADWREHLRVTYSDVETDTYFAAWAEEDVYVPLPHELELLHDAGFTPEVVWRQGVFAVIAARSH